MKKRIFLGLVLAALAVGGAFAQEEAKNTFTGGFDLGIWSGVSFSYDRVFVDNFLGSGQVALGVEGGYDSILFVIPDVFIDIQAKWFPWSGKFYADVGLGFAQLVWIVPSMMVTGGIGWKIDIGESNGFVLDFGGAFDYFVIMGKLDEGKSSNIRVKARIGYSW
jgi:hypothetical protein